MTQPPQYPSTPGDGDDGYPQQPQTPYGQASGATPGAANGALPGQWEASLTVLRGDGRMSIKESLTMGMTQLVRNPMPWVVVAIAGFFASLALGGLLVFALIYAFASIFDSGTDADPGSGEFGSMLLALGGLILVGLIISAIVTPMVFNVSLKMTSGVRAEIKDLIPARGWLNSALAVFLYSLPVFLIGIGALNLLGKQAFREEFMSHLSGYGELDNPWPLIQIFLGLFAFIVLMALVIFLLSPFFALWPVLPLLEDISLIDALGRSIKLGKQNYGGLLGLTFFTQLLAQFSGQAFQVTAFVGSIAGSVASMHAARRITGHEYATLPKQLID
ncbi:hypothetical protein [Corynebacterium aquilae]|uniref:Uncharacterized protein n=1 Tax=Corynebacterium aquilae DSM 44791 TaxID=1431546 RepID=A0A1L7CGE5_9CORY|nr:hypothetical protein [Corynebacterium aquilae]APT84909.1 hypothetical protein CAQU_07350 [Corynebacterium aquilae DSM 44791]